MLRINQSKITRPQPSAQTTRVKQVAPTHSRLLEVIGIAILFGGFRKKRFSRITCNDIIFLKRPWPRSVQHNNREQRVLKVKTPSNS